MACVLNAAEEWVDPAKSSSARANVRRIGVRFGSESFRPDSIGPQTGRSIRVEGYGLQNVTRGVLRNLIANSITIRIIHTALFSFICYLTIGFLLAVLPGFVYLHLGFSPLWAGVVVSSQYLATLVTRPTAGRAIPWPAVLSRQSFGRLWDG